MSFVCSCLLVGLSVGGGLVAVSEVVLSLLKLSEFFALLIPQSIRPASTSLMKYQVLDSPSVEPNESDKFVYTDYIDKFIALPS